MLKDWTGMTMVSNARTSKELDSNNMNSMRFINKEIRRESPKQDFILELYFPSK